MFKALATSLLLGFLTVDARVINIEAVDDDAQATWTRTPYARVVDLSQGDTLRFISNWNQHNVVLSNGNREGTAGLDLDAFNTCNVTQAELLWNVVRPNNGGDPVFDLDTSDLPLGVYYAMCTRGSPRGIHCEQGMKVQITVNAPGMKFQPKVVGLEYAQRPLAWVTGLDYPDLANVAVGDILRWTIQTASHNLLVDTTGDASADRCNQDLYDATLVESETNGPVVTFDYVIPATGQYSFACFYRTSHCATMQFNVDVPEPAPAPAPVKGGGSKKNIGAAVGAVFLVTLGAFARYRFKKSDEPELQESDDTVDVEGDVVIHT